MKRPRRELKVDGAVELPHVISYLEQLVQALRSGTVRVHRGEDHVVLGPRGVLGFSIAVAEKGKRQKLALELTWRRYDAPDADLDLVIRPAMELPAAAETVEDVASASASAARATEVASPEPPVPGEVVLGEPE
jgi:amphi-Trp domain-containing protein